ncbi:MAG TPA: MoaD/ThiS family protein [Acidimicrobiia bacterium]|jgi:molybdopterin converting factor small subunit|nr:MoaD/ThiS family protein [Acidimicrobiia bacterium]
MPATVRIPTSLRSLTDGSAVVEVQPGKLDELLGDLATRYPELGERLLEDGRPRRFVNIFVAEDDIRFLDGVDTPVGEGQVVTILPAVAGG